MKYENIIQNYFRGDMLMKSITDIIAKNIREYNVKLAEKYNLDIAELDELWEEVSGDFKPKKTRAKKTDKKEDGDKKEKSSKPATKKSTEGGCPYTFTKGKNEGTVCGSKPKDGGEYCSKHQKFEGVGQTEKKKIPTPEKSATTSDGQEKKKRIVIRMNKDIDKYWNPETKMVFKSKEEKIVIGKYEDEEVKKLTKQDIETCEKIGFKYDSTNSAQDDEEAAEEEDEVEDEIPELEEE